MDHIEETKRLLELWSPVPLEEDHRISTDELEAFEDRISMQIPAVWRSWLREFGRHPLILGTEAQGDGFLRLEQIERWFSADRPSVYSIAGETQNNWSWGVRPQDMAESDPTIWMDREAAWMLKEFGKLEGREEDGLVETTSSTSEFLVGFLIRTIPYQAFDRPDETLRRSVTFRQIKDDELADRLIRRFGMSAALGEPAAMDWQPLCNDARDIIFIKHWGIATVGQDVGPAS